MSALQQAKGPAGQKAVLFTAGLLGVAHETLVSAGERPTLLLLFAAMVGLPAFLAKDEKGGDS